MTMMPYAQLITEARQAFEIRVNAVENICREQLGREWRLLENGGSISVKIEDQPREVLKEVVTRWNRAETGWAVQRPNDDTLVWWRR